MVEARHSGATQLAALSVAIAVAVLSLKAVAWWVTGSVALYADALESIVNVAAAIAALIGIAEPVLGPLWVWLIHQETPRAATLWGGGVVFVALLAHVLWQLREAPPTEA